jgi:hypothetical protein
MRHFGTCGLKSFGHELSYLEFVLDQQNFDAIHKNPL